MKRNKKKIGNKRRDEPNKYVPQGKLKPMSLAGL